ncbi:MAG TPA: glycosyltransferase family 4 protein, partial [Candidatus Dormibacteraeota bacterium]|nr:glycosyltransferase family 4 protein [Candidatus Dormibacteraeota bacterium]
RAVATIEVPAPEVFDLLLVPPEIAAGARRGFRVAGRRPLARRRGLRIVQTYERPGFGEPERTIETLTGQWLEAGHEVWTWLPGATSDGPPADLPGVVCDAYPREVRPDVVVVHGGLHGAASAGLCERMTGAPVVEIVHRRRPALAGASAHVAVSRAVAAVQKAVRCAVVPPGVRVRPPQSTRAGVRSTLGIGRDDVVVVRHAEIETDKGWHWTMQVMLRVWASGLDAWLLVAGGGSGPAAAVLRAWAAGQPRVLLESGDRRWDLLAAADLALETSPAEGFGLAVAEAGAAGLPVVAFGTPGVAETLGRGYPTVRLGDAAGAAEALVRLAGDVGARAELGQRLRARVARRHDPAAAARRYVSVFESLV